MNASSKMMPPLAAATAVSVRYVAAGRQTRKP